MITKSQAIATFLNKMTHPHLARLYNLGMECQVNVSRGDGEIIKGEYNGRKWTGYTDGVTTWKSFRIPYNAMKSPTYEDKPLNFDLTEHVEGIGMSGWDWKHLVSRWVAFDFDSIIGHESGLKQDVIDKIKESVNKVDWVTTMYSTSGNGLHLYVFLDPISTSNHHEHSAVARAVLGKLSALVGYNLSNDVDCCGGNMWIWHRKMKDTKGLTIIKQGTVLKDVPQNWRDHLTVISGSRRKNLPKNIEEIDNFTLLTNSKHRVKLDDGHRMLIDYLEQSNALWWWDQDNYMLVTHTIHLKDAFVQLKLKGYFETISTGKEKGMDHNCFLFPLANGAWSVRRYTLGIQEHTSWDQDGSGWTRTYLNREMDLRGASRSSSGLEDPTSGKDGGGFVFETAKDMLSALDKLNIKTSIDYTLDRRKSRLKESKDGRIIVEISKEDSDNVDSMKGWLPKKDKFVKILNYKNTVIAESELSNHDNLIRHLITEDLKDIGWCLYSDGEWRHEPLQNVKLSLSSLGYNNQECTDILGTSVRKCWKLVNKPFQSEYPGNREWNKDGAQFRFIPTKDKEILEYDTWMKILNHCGNGLTNIIKDNKWCKMNGIVTGGQYLKCWIASMFQNPFEPLPYLFFYGKQKSGKTVFYESLSLLLTKGYKKSDLALKSQGDFNSELEGAILCVLDEVDLRSNKQAYNKIKDWVTAKDIVIHRKGLDRYQIQNTTHWVQCGNDHSECPIFPGDTRITMCYVEQLDPLKLIPRKKLVPKLESEASDFLAAVLSLEIPESNDRLNVPVIETGDKIVVQEMNRTYLESFLAECCVKANGYTIKFSEFYDRYIMWLDYNERKNWSKIKVGKYLPPQYPKGRKPQDNQFYIGNISWVGIDNIENKNKLIKQDEYLVDLVNND